MSGVRAGNPGVDLGIRRGSPHVVASTLRTLRTKAAQEIPQISPVAKIVFLTVNNQPSTVFASRAVGGAVVTGSAGLVETAIGRIIYQLRSDFRGHVFEGFGVNCSFFRSSGQRKGGSHLGTVLA